MTAPIGVTPGPVVSPAAWAREVRQLSEADLRIARRVVGLEDRTGLIVGRLGAIDGAIREVAGLLAELIAEHHDLCEALKIRPRAQDGGGQ